MAPEVVGAPAFIPVNKEREENVAFVAKVFNEVITNAKLHGLEESVHAPPGVRKLAREARLAVSNASKTKIDTPVGVDAKIDAKARCVVEPGVSTAAAQATKANDDSKEKDASVHESVTRSINVANQVKKRLAAARVNPCAQPFVPPFYDATTSKTALDTKENTGIVEPKDSDGGWSTDGKTAEKTSLPGYEESTSSQPRRGVVSPAEFMKHVRLLREMKLKAAKAAAVGEPRRIIFGNLPEWLDISNLLHIVCGGAIERAWRENDKIIVQFLNKNDCDAYYEVHADGITLIDNGEEFTISLTKPDDGLPDHPELLMRVNKGASRVVSLKGVQPGIKGSGGETILGIVSASSWEDKDFDHILIRKGMIGGIDVYIFFYGLHDGWEFLESIKEGAYDCIANFEVDPCTSGTCHFVDEPNRMFAAFSAID